MFDRLERKKRQEALTDNLEMADLKESIAIVEGIIKDQFPGVLDGAVTIDEIGRHIEVDYCYVAGLKTQYEYQNLSSAKREQIVDGLKSLFRKKWIVSDHWGQKLLLTPKNW